MKYILISTDDHGTKEHERSTNREYIYKLKKQLELIFVDWDFEVIRVKDKTAANKDKDVRR